MSLSSPIQPQLNHDATPLSTATSGENFISVSRIEFLTAVKRREGHTHLTWGDQRRRRRHVEKGVSRGGFTPHRAHSAGIGSFSREKCVRCDVPQARVPKSVLSVRAPNTCFMFFAAFLSRISVFDSCVTRDQNT